MGNALKSTWLYYSLITIAASTITFLGWASLHLVPQTERWGWIILPGGFLATPGFLFAVLVAIVFSPDGGHGASDFSQFVIPVNLIFYFLLFLLVFRRKRNEID